MIISVEELKEYIETDEKDAVLGARLQALENLIRKRTNNNFQNRAFRFECDVTMDNGLQYASPLFKVGDTVELSNSLLNKGVYTIASIDLDNGCMGLNKTLFDESDVLVTKIIYPEEVKMGVIDIMKWKLRNEAAANGDTSKKDIASETISRHSVSYVTDATESDIDVSFGVPKKYLAFLRAYQKARF